MTIRPVEHEPDRYWVTSATTPGVVHLVDVNYDGKPGCSCQDHMVRERECKHIRLVLDYLAARGIVPNP